MTYGRRCGFAVCRLAAVAEGPYRGRLRCQSAASGIKNVVLVHGGFVDGSGWEGVYKILRKDGFTVTIVQNPTISLAGDVAVTKRALAAQGGPAILVGHSYGGVVITEAGNDPNVAGLVYIAAFAPGQGRVGGIADQGSGARRAGAADPAAAGWLPVPRQGEVRRRPSRPMWTPDAAAFMADAQVPWGLEALSWRDHRAGVEVEAELVPGDDRTTG